MSDGKRRPIPRHHTPPGSARSVSRRVLGRGAPRAHARTNIRHFHLQESTMSHHTLTLPSSPLPRPRHGATTPAFARIALCAVLLLAPACADAIYYSELALPPHPMR